MAVNIIKIKRTTGTTAPSSLSAGELAYSGGAGTQGNNGQRLFIGDPANSNAVTVIGGNYFSNLMDHAHGTTTASSVLIVDTNKSVSEVRTPALYLGTSGNDTLVTATAADVERCREFFCKFNNAEPAFLRLNASVEETEDSVHVGTIHGAKHRSEQT